MLFPLGMYTVAVFQLPKAIGLDFLFLISRYSLYIAVCAWLVMFVGFVHKRAARPAPPTRGATLRSHFTKQRLCQAPEML